MADERALDFGGADAMAGDVEDVIDAADDPEISVFILPATVAGEIAPLHFGPIDLLVSLGIAPKTPQHAGPRFANDQLSARALRHGVSIVVNNFRHDSEEGQCR